MFLVFRMALEIFGHLMSMSRRWHWFTNGVQCLFGDGLLSFALLTHANSILQGIHNVND